MATVTPVIDARGLTARYGDVEALRGIELTVARGEVFAILGPNGAGKTTTVELLAGFRHRSGGEVRVLGVDPGSAGAAWRARIGVVLQESEPDPGLTVREAVALYAGYHAEPREVVETLNLVGLDGYERVTATTLSGGQRRRLDVALALVGRPELLFLDEPTTGFDPAARRASWHMIEALRRDGTTIVLTTHAMDEAARLADRIAIVAGGLVIASGTPAAVGERAGAPGSISFGLAGGAVDRLPPALGDRIEVSSGGRFSLATDAPLDDVEAIARWARTTGAVPVELEVRRPSLEDAYLSLIAATEVAR